MLQQIMNILFGFSIDFSKKSLLFKNAHMNFWCRLETDNAMFLKLPS